MNDTLISLAIIFCQLSLLAFGGGNTILPEMHVRWSTCITGCPPASSARFSRLHRPLRVRT